MFIHEYGSYFYVEGENLFEVIKELEANDKEVSFRFSKEALEELDKGVQVPKFWKVMAVILYMIAITLFARLLF